MNKLLLPSLELAILIINFLSTKLKVPLKTLQIENFKKNLRGKKTSCYTTTQHKTLTYILIYKTCDNLYVGQSQDFKQIISKHTLDVKNLHNSTCRICSEYLRDCIQDEPYFQIFPFYYETNTALRTKRYILRWKPALNLNKT